MYITYKPKNIKFILLLGSFVFAAVIFSVDSLMGLIALGVAFGAIILAYIHYHRNGKIDEGLVHLKLKCLPRKKYHTFYNVLFIDGEHSTQIDHLVVSQFGIFVIETKGYKGKIYGGEKSQYWQQWIKGKKFNFYNPILQNAGHTRFLGYLLKDIADVAFIPIIVFANKAQIRSINSKIVINRKRLLRTILRYKTETLTADDVEKIIACINQHRCKDKKEADLHLKNARAKQIEAKIRISEGRCPRCGSELVERFGQNGLFVSCSNYPKCNYTSKF